MSTSQPKIPPLSFSWGRKRRVGSKKGTQFYESFVFDGVEYSLFDCVYLFKKGDAAPHVGKLVKMWEQPGEKRRVKVHWFFYPWQIRDCLGDREVERDEVFLAAGDGKGAFNVNPLEVIGGKCSVICTSKDSRNRQPTQEELKMADYIFYRTFNVENFVISDKIEDTIAGTETESLFNSKEPMKLPPLCEIKADGVINKENAVEVNLAKMAPDEKVTTKLETLPGSDKSKVDNVKVTGDDVKPQAVQVSYPKGAHDDRPSKKMRMADSVIKLSHFTEKAVEQERAEKKLKNEFDKDSARKVKKVKKVKLVKKQVKDSNKLGVSPHSSVDVDRKAANQPLEVTQRTANDRSKWFADIPWDSAIESANDQGRLVMLNNLDPDYSRTEMEDLIHHAFNQNCSVRLIEQHAFTNPHHGQALVIFKSSDAAAQVLQKLDEEILMLPNGRPLVATQGVTRPPGKKSSALIGLLSIDKYTKLKKVKEDLRRVATASHYSQGNTIEYEMGMEWMFLEDRSKRWWDELHKEHSKEIKALSKNLKTK